MWLPKEIDPGAEKTEKLPALVVPPVFGVLPFTGSLNPLTRSNTAHRISMTIPTHATEGERGWGTAQAGHPVDVMLAKRLANPLIVVDEICKAKSVTSNTGTSYSFGDALLSLLEPATAKAWDCPYFRVRFDMSHISWVLTSNDVGNVSEPVRSRCQVVEIPDVTMEQLQEFALRKGEAFGLSEAAVDAVFVAIAQESDVTGRRQSLRDIVRMLERAEMLEGRPRLQ